MPNNQTLLVPCGPHIHAHAWQRSIEDNFSTCPRFVVAENRHKIDTDHDDHVEHAQKKHTPRSRPSGHACSTVFPITRSFMRRPLVQGIAQRTHSIPFIMAAALFSCRRSAERRVRASSSLREALSLEGHDGGAAARGIAPAKKSRSLRKPQLDPSCETRSSLLPFPERNRCPATLSAQLRDHRSVGVIQAVSQLSVARLIHALSLREQCHSLEPAFKRSFQLSSC